MVHLAGVPGLDHQADLGPGLLAHQVVVDGGHGEEPAWADYRGWAPKVMEDGWLAIHDVFPDPADGGRAPYEQIFRPALDSGLFRLHSATGSLRVLVRV